MNNLANLIEPIIDKYGRFPTYTEISNEIGFKSTIDSKEKLAQTKLILNYNDENNLTDDRGFLNRSSYEYITAQFLIHNNVMYKREQRPFLEIKKGFNYRSDFTFYTIYEEEIHLEIWGMENMYNYDIKMEDKIKLYSNNNVKLISLYPSDFNGKYNDIQNLLQLKLSSILNIELKKVKQEVLIPGHLMSDEELLNKIMEYSDDNIAFPSYDKLKKERQSTLSRNVLKRYSSMSELAIKYRKIPCDTPMDYWTKDRIISVLENKIIRDGFLGSNKDLDNFRGGFSSIIISRYKGSAIYAKIDFYKYYINNGNILPIVELEYLKNILSKGKYYRTVLTDENKQDIKFIIDSSIKDVS